METIRRGTLKGWNAGSYTAVVWFTGGQGVYVTEIPVARNIAAVELVVGRNMAGVWFDGVNQGDAVLVAVWS